MATAAAGAAWVAEADVPDNPGPPGVKAKEIEAVVLLARRLGAARLNLGPFLAAYAALGAALLQQSLTSDRPQLVLYACIAVSAAHVLSFLFTHWSIAFNAAVNFRRVAKLADAEYIHVIPHKFGGQAAIVPLEFRTARDPHSGEERPEVAFEFRKLRFNYHAPGNAFERLRFPVHEPFAYYLRASGYGAPDKVAAAAAQWGLNKFEVPVPPFGELLKEQMLAPFFVFQVLCVGLWCLDEYWYYSLFTLGMLIMFECTVVMQRTRNLRELRALQTPKQRLLAYRAGKWEEVPGEALLPGDVVSIVRPKGGPGAEEKVIPADCLLLAGDCIVEEAVLTGESTPQWKLPVGGGGVSPDETLHIKSHRQHVLFGGTRVLQHTGDKAARLRTPDGGCLAVVVRTGFETSQGQLMRTILYSTERITANSWETGAFIAFLLVFAVAASGYVLHHGLADASRDRFKLLLNCIMIITSVIPPELPMELTIAVNSSLVALARKAIFCTEPFRIPFAGKVEVCCFDKTGTLTTDHLLLEGLAGLPERPPLELVLDPAALPAAACHVLAACQSLVQVEGELIGDPLEKAALQACRWTYGGDVAISPDKRVRAAVVQRYHFSSALRRMGAVILVDAGEPTGPAPVAVLKGAPEVVRQHLATVPPHYDATYKHFAAQGARVIALASRRLSRELSGPDLRALPREEAEAGMTFEGFAVFQCPLKPESAPSLAALAASSHMLVMITGDAPLTAAHAARQVGIVTRPVLVLQHKLEAAGDGPGAHHTPGSAAADAEFEWLSPDESTRLPFSRDWDELLLLASENDLCLTGDALAHVEGAGLGRRVIPLVQVFARVSPEQKELVLQALRACGWTTLMVGDGTNDVGGLKAAHVGVALLAPSALAEQAQRKHRAGDKQDKQRGRAGGASHAGASPAAPAPAPAPRGGRPGELAAPRPGGAGAGKGKKGDKPPPGAALVEQYRAAGRPVPPAVQRMADMLDRLDAEAAGGADGPPMVKPGDASMAAPFTAKAGSVAPVLDVLGQGRCTLVTTVQMFKILGLSCLSTAYALSVMYLQGVKLSDAQATLSGLLTAGLFYFISAAQPLPALSAERPHPSIFCAYFFASLLGQFAAQLALLVGMYRLALGAMPPAEAQGSESDFAPNLVNSVCYLVQQAMQLTTFAVNYVGHPFNTSLADNAGMAKSLRGSAAFLGVLVLEWFPPLNESFGLVPIPLHLRAALAAGVAAVVVSTFAWEHGLRAAFPAPRPPPKGYLAHGPALERARRQRGALAAGGGGSAAKKRHRVSLTIASSDNAALHLPALQRALARLPRLDTLCLEAADGQLSSPESLAPLLWAVGGELPGLRALELELGGSSWEGSDAAWRAIGRGATKLTRLAAKFYGQCVTLEHFSLLSALGALASLSVAGSRQPHSQQCYDWLGGLAPSLTHLWLPLADDRVGLAAVAACTGLRSLALSGRTDQRGLSVAECGALARLVALTRLDLLCVEQGSDPALLEAAVALPRLAELHVAGLSRAALPHLARLTALTRLQGSWIWDDDAPEAGPVPAACPSVVELVGGDNVPWAAFPGLRRMQSRGYMAAHHLQALTQCCTALTALGVGGMRWSGDALECVAALRGLARLPALRELQLTIKCCEQAAALYEVTQLTRLRVCIDDLRVDDNGEFALPQPTSVPPLIMAALGRSMPELRALEVDWPGGSASTSPAEGTALLGALAHVRCVMLRGVGAEAEGALRAALSCADACGLPRPAELIVHSTIA
ncbi:PDR2 [Scenedesmus sp. PABB004]|nr:PDR2 [Scenedesmus sp. PABB004]